MSVRYEVVTNKSLAPGVYEATLLVAKDKGDHLLVRVKVFGLPKKEE